MPIQKVNTSRNTATRSTYVGEKGRLFYDEANGVLYISDGRTAGGSSIFTKLVNGNYSATLDASGNFTVPGNLTVQGTTTTVTNEVVNNNDTITGTLTVGGNSTFNGTVNTLTNANLIGTGQNFLVYSNQIGNNQYGLNGTASVVLNSATDPLGGTTATTITSASDLTWGGNNVRQIFTSLTNTQYTFSCYLKLGTATTVSIGMRDNTTGNLPTTAFTTAGIWQRVSVTMTTGASTTNPAIMLGSANGTFYAWGAQINFGATAGTFIATTDAPIAGYPAINFSGSASIKMDASGNLLIAPGGSGTVQIGNTAGNYVQISNAASGTTPTISAQGVDTGISLYYTAKGNFSSHIFTSGQGNLFQTTGPANGNFSSNRLITYSAGSGYSPLLGVTGSDSTINLSLSAKSGLVIINNPSTQNLFTYSNTFSNGAWSKSATAVTATVATTDPFGGSSAWLLVGDVTASSKGMYFIGTQPTVVGTTNIQSIYVKAAGYTLVQMSDIGASAWCARFDLSAVTATPVVGCTAAITAVTGQAGWYRISVTISPSAVIISTTRPSVIGYPSSGATPNNYSVTYTGDATNGIYIYGAQAEMATTLGTYVATASSTVVYTAPIISFNSSASTGLQADGSIFLQPAGSGALQAQATTSSAVGGNIRGQYAVDWQLSRATSTQVASGSYTVIAGGYNNTNTGSYSVISGGYNNSSAGGGSVISGGNSNTVGSNRGVVVGGQNNNASGLFGIVVGGANNLATSSTAVTTAVMTIAVTASTTLYLTATNANVKIGQYIVGPTQDTYATSTVTTGTTALNTAFTSTGSVIAVTTGILTIGTLTAGTIVAGQVLSGTGVPAGTYVVSNIAGGSASGSTWNTNIITAVASTAINGTAYTITISQNTTTAAGTTITFYTPHGVVVGGGNNQATGSFSFIGAGGDAGTAANRNIASGAWSTVVGGIKNTASGAGSFIGGGGLYDAQLTPAANLASGASSVIVGGSGNTATSSYGMILGGRGNYVDALMGAVIGGAYGSTRGITGNTVFPGNYAALGNFSVTAVQAALLVIAKQTTDATPIVLTSDGGSGVSSNQVYLQSNSAYYFNGSVIAGVTGGGNTKAWTFEGAIKKGAANSIALVGSPTVTSSFADSGASSWSIALTANTTTDTLTVTVTGQAATTIRWVCKIETTEMNF